MSDRHLRSRLPLTYEEPLEEHNMFTDEETTGGNSNSNASAANNVIQQSEGSPNLLGNIVEDANVASAGGESVDAAADIRHLSDEELDDAIAEEEAEIARLELEASRVRKQRRLRELRARKKLLGEEIQLVIVQPGATKKKPLGTSVTTTHQPTGYRAPTPPTSRKTVTSGSDTEAPHRREAPKMASRHVTLTDLRGDKDLSAAVNQQLAEINVFPSSADSSSTGSDGSGSERRRRKKKRSRKRRVKSGKHFKVSSHVVSQEMWPHAYLAQTQYTKRDTKYEDLTMEEFVAGYTSILNQPDINAVEMHARISHLSHLMYLSMIYQWKAVLNFHSLCLLEIERRILKWGDSFSHLESISLSAALKQKSSQSNLSGSQSSSQPAPPLYCYEYQKGTCSFAESHMGSFKGQRRLLQHICAACLLK